MCACLHSFVDKLVVPWGWIAGRTLFRMKCTRTVCGHPCDAVGTVMTCSHDQLTCAYIGPALPTAQWPHSLSVTSRWRHARAAVSVSGPRLGRETRMPTNHAAWRHPGHSTTGRWRHRCGPPEPETVLPRRRRAETPDSRTEHRAVTEAAADVTNATRMNGLASEDQRLVVFPFPL